MAAPGRRGHRCPAKSRGQNCQTFDSRRFKGVLLFCTLGTEPNATAPPQTSRSGRSRDSDLVTRITHITVISLSYHSYSYLVCSNAIRFAKIQKETTNFNRDIQQSYSFRLSVLHGGGKPIMDSRTNTCTCSFWIHETSLVGHVCVFPEFNRKICLACTTEPSPISSLQVFSSTKETERRNGEAGTCGTRYTKKKREKETKQQKASTSHETSVLTRYKLINMVYTTTCSDVMCCAFSAHSRDPLKKPARETFEQLR